MKIEITTTEGDIKTVSTVSVNESEVDEQYLTQRTNHDVESFEILHS